ncbi:MAG: manganese efflux pump [Halothece sp.]
MAIEQRRESTESRFLENRIKQFELMETLLSSLLLSLSTNIDNLAVGMAYGIKRLAIGFSANIVIALLSGMSTFFSMSLGDWIHSFLSRTIAHQLGSGILIIIGFFTVWQFLKTNFNKSEQTEEILNLRSHKGMGLREALFLGMALTITNLGTGIGAGIAELDLVLTSCFSFGSSLLMIGGGAFLGQVLTAKFSGSRLELVSGILLICLGIYEYLMP